MSATLLVQRPGVAVLGVLHLEAQLREAVADALASARCRSASGGLCPFFGLNL